MRVRHLPLMIGVTTAALFVLLGAHCRGIVPTPVPDAGPPPVDAWVDPWAEASADAPLTACELGCAQLARLGCTEGEFTGCATLADQVNAARMTVMPCACWSVARTAAEARACGNVTCPGGSP